MPADVISICQNALHLPDFMALGVDEPSNEDLEYLNCDNTFGASAFTHRT